jgi:hypothetical protein
MTLCIRNFLTFTLTLLMTTTPIRAMPRGGGGNRGNVRSTSRSSVNEPNRNANVNRNNNVNRNKNVNRNTNVNVNRNVDVNVHGNYYGGGGYYGGGCCYHPVATAAAVTAATMVTAAVVGSIVSSPPTNCSVVSVNGVTYQQCGNTWYQPQFSGGNTTYVVVNPPR